MTIASVHFNTKGRKSVRHCRKHSSYYGVYIAVNYFSSITEQLSQQIKKWQKKTNLNISRSRRTFTTDNSFASIKKYQYNGFRFGYQQTEAQWKLNNLLVVIDSCLNVQEDLVHYKRGMIAKRCKNVSDRWQFRCTKRT